MSESASGASGEGILSAEELVEHLGLGAEESLRILDAGPRLLLLERVGESQVLPVEGAPTVAAEVARYALADLFQWIEAGTRSGFLHFCHRDHAKSIYFHRGEVVFASSNQLVDRLGESLLRAGVLNLEQLREAQRCFSLADRMGKILVEHGFLTPRELWNGVKYQVEEIVRSLFAYTAGRMRFWEGDFQPDNVVRLSLPNHRLVAEGLQRREELARFLAVLEDPRVRLSAVKAVEAELSGPERALARTIPEEGSFPVLCERLSLDRESAARSVQLLRLVGAVKLLRSEEAEGDFMSASDLEERDQEGLRQTVRGLVKLIGELATPIAEADGDSGLQQRLADTLDDAATRFPGLLNGISLGPAASLDPEQLIDRALRLPGDPEPQVTAALGELVAYLEFEIMNHPGIDDPQAVLAKAAELRQAF